MPAPPPRQLKLREPIPAAAVLLADLRRRGVELRIEHGMIKHRAPTGALRYRDIHFIDAREPELIEILTTEETPDGPPRPAPRD